jgi:UDP-glucoronosyl and UDP-glucosyl transferase
MDRMKNERYDILVAAAYESDGTAYGLAHVLDIPSTVGFVATAYMDEPFHLLGIPTPPSFTTSLFLQRPVGGRPSLWERAVSALRLLGLRGSRPLGVSAAQSVFTQHYGPEFPALDDLGRKMSYFFLNTNEIIDVGKPLSAKVKFIGGIGMRKPEAGRLGAELEELLANSGPSGVILLSFGSLIPMEKVPHAAKMALIRALARFPDYTVIWKHDGFTAADEKEERELFATAPNIHLLKWIPQVELLNDPRIKVFISHAGQNSYLEATHAGVPMIGEWWMGGRGRIHGIPFLQIL